MWTFNGCRVARAILACAIAAFALMIAAPSRAAPPQYVQICSIYGEGFFVLPGTDTCTDAKQIAVNQFAIARAATQAATGTAMTAALVNPWLPDHTNYAISMHWAGFDGQNAVGVAGLVRIKGNLAFSAGFSVGLDHGSLTPFTNRTATEFGVSYQQQSWSDVIVLGRVGLQYAW